MKAKRIELDVDFIGTQPSKLTMEEEKMISDYLRLLKAKIGRKKAKEKVDVMETKI